MQLHDILQLPHCKLQMSVIAASAYQLHKNMLLCEANRKDTEAQTYLRIFKLDKDMWSTYFIKNRSKLDNRRQTRK